VAAQPILYAYRIQALSVEVAILLFRALPTSLEHTSFRLHRMDIAVTMYTSETPAPLQQYCSSEDVLCFKKSFTTLKAYMNFFRGYVQCFELS
jgi:hypothetical protein